MSGEDHFRKCYRFCSIQSQDSFKNSAIETVVFKIKHSNNTTKNMFFFHSCRLGNKMFSVMYHTQRKLYKCSEVLCFIVLNLSHSVLALCCWYCMMWRQVQYWVCMRCVQNKGSGKPNAATKVNTARNASDSLQIDFELTFDYHMYRNFDVLPNLHHPFFVTWSQKGQ